MSSWFRIGRKRPPRWRVLLWIGIAILSTGAGLLARSEIERRVARWTWSPAADSRREGGTLLIAGGGRLPDGVKRHFLELAGGDKARLVVIPAANEDDSGLREYREEWSQFSPKSVEVLHSDSRTTSENPDFSRCLDDATGVWLGGGQQTWLAGWYRDTPVQERLLGVLARGGVIGGTSAGASAMSDPMIAGGRETPHRGRGLGLVQGVIIDQHFVRRNRIGRLLNMLDDYPDHVGLGVDERTAVILSVRSGRFRIVGDSCAVACCNLPGSPRPRIEFFDAGDEFDLASLRNGTPTPPSAGFDLEDILGE